MGVATTECNVAMSFGRKHFGRQTFRRHLPKETYRPVDCRPNDGVITRSTKHCVCTRANVCRSDGFRPRHVEPM